MFVNDFSLAYFRIRNDKICQCMWCQAEKKELEEVKPAGIVQQTPFWGKVKRRQGCRLYPFLLRASRDLMSLDHHIRICPNSDPSTSVKDDLLVFVQQVSKTHCVAYVPYGPKKQPVDEQYGPFLEELSETLRSFLPANCLLIRYDLPWENQWARENDFSDEKGHWIDAPSVLNQEFRLNFNTSRWNLSKSPSDILPTSTYFLDLKQDKEALLDNMKPKTRYNIRLSDRKGVRVRVCGPENLDEWYVLYRETARRNRVTLHDKSYFQTVLEQEKNDSSASVRLLMGEHNNECLSAMFLVISNKRATYLYGASSSYKRNCMASYALQWKAMCVAKSAGCHEYDMFGSAPNANPAHPLYGLYRFKSGFGGQMYHRMGCWDYPLNHEAYTAYKAQEVKNQQYHLS